MAISRAQLLKELLPGLNALFGLEYKKYGEQHKEIFETESSERSFEEETKLSGFNAAPVKNEGSAMQYGGFSPKARIPCICSTRAAPCCPTACPSSASRCRSSRPISPRSIRRSIPC